MTAYALIKNPAYTRVSFQDSDSLAQKELVVTAESICAKNIRFQEIGGLSCVLFDCKQLSQDAICTLSRLSFVFAIFELVGQDPNILLKPITVTQLFYRPRIKRNSEIYR